MIANGKPDEPMHLRYEVAHDFLAPETGWEVVTISRLVNAFFRWEFNSCESLVRGTAELYDLVGDSSKFDRALRGRDGEVPESVDTSLT